MSKLNRQLGIGASEAAAALRLSRYESPIDVYLRKIKEHHIGGDETAETTRGKMLEPYVMDIYEREGHGKLIRSPDAAFSTEHDFMFATLDAIRNEDHRPVEVKTAGQFVAHEWGEEGTDNVPQEYLIQLTQQMIVKKKPIGDLAALITLDDFRVYNIRFDSEFAGMIVEGLSMFWARVINREPPPPENGEDATKLYTRSYPNAIEADENMVKIYAEYTEARRARKAWTEREERLKGDLKLLMRESDTLLIDRVPAATWKTSRNRLVFNEESFKAIHPELYKTFLVEVQGARPFLTKGDTNE